jgi:hypothetical protein
VSGWQFVKAKFKVGDLVWAPHGRKKGVVRAVGVQEAFDIHYPGEKLILSIMYKVGWRTYMEAQLRRRRRT